MTLLAILKWIWRSGTVWLFVFIIIAYLTIRLTIEILTIKGPDFVTEWNYDIHQIKRNHNKFGKPRNLKDLVRRIVAREYSHTEANGHWIGE